MGSPERQDTNTGSGAGKPIPAGAPSTADASKPFQPPTSIAPASISIPEALSLLQTLCFDLRSAGCRAAILAKDKRAYVIIQVPASIGAMTVSAGNLCIDGKPVAEG